jgi:uncharacterized Zn-binding protein involved in type VI secretion
MSIISQGLSKVVAYKKETTFGEPAGAAGGKQLRRVTADFNLTKEAYSSSEIRTSRQNASSTHGVRSADGTLSAELSAGSYADFTASILARNFTAVTLGAAVEATLTVVGSTYKFVRAAGSFITDGFREGLIVNTAGLTEADDNGRNFLVVFVTALEATFVPLDEMGAPAAQAVASSVTFTVPGKETYIPQSGHTEDSYTVEEWYSDIEQSQVFTGMKVNSMGVSMPSTGIVTTDFGFAGKDMALTGNTQYFTTPTAQSTSGVMASVSGAVVVNGVRVALITSIDFTVDRATENATAVGSNSVADIFTSRILVSGNASIYFADGVFRDYFNNETEVSIVLGVSTDACGTGSAMSFTFPRVKINSFSNADSETGVTASVAWEALEGCDGMSTVYVQDTLA